MNHPEYNLQRSICKYINLQYPEVMYLSDTIAACKLSIPQASRNKAIQCPNFKCPDLLILEPRGKYYGLFIELKTESPFKKDGTIKASQNDHLKLQKETMDKLQGKGYLCMFGWGFDSVKGVIDDYINNNLE